jgi:hypothetical protein
MPLVIDSFNKLLLITSPDTSVSLQVISDFIEDFLASPVGMVNDGVWPGFAGQGDIQKPEGKIEDIANPGIFSQIIVILAPQWQIQFWGGSGYTRLFGGKLIGGVGNEPMKATGTAGDITVLESPVDGVTVLVGSGLDSAQDQKLTDIDSRTLYHSKIINNVKELRKIATSWYLIIYDTGEVSGGSEILRKKMTDTTGADINDLTAGVLAAELESTA